MKQQAAAIIFLLATTSFAFAGGGAPVPGGTQEPDPSGRPGKILDNTECQKVWEMASPGGDVDLSEGKAEPFVLNFQMVDSDSNDRIKKSEFEEGCKKGWIKSADDSTMENMEGTPAGE
ncbi:hypothetical protein [Methyloceanibacter caenitepidi]|nr:hypothetical protein [Methyloceanibacter caenitepidi]